MERTIDQFYHVDLHWRYLRKEENVFDDGSAEVSKFGYIEWKPRAQSFAANDTL